MKYIINLIMLLKKEAKKRTFCRNNIYWCKFSKIKEHKKIGNILNVTVDFIAEVITCIRDKDKKIVSGDPEKIKKIYDTWVFSRDTTNLQIQIGSLVNILT